MRILLLVAMFAFVVTSSAFADASKGEALYKDKRKGKCTVCHAWGKKKLGPDLTGITSRVPEEWLRKWLTDPKATWIENDATTQELKKKTRGLKRKKPKHKPPTLTADNVNDLVDFLKTK